MNDRQIEALDYIKGQLKCGYIDISDMYPDELEFKIVKEAIDYYERLLETRDEIIEKLNRLMNNEE